MMQYPQYVKIGDRKYKINSDFRVALRCDQVSKDESIGDYERALAIIYLLFGDKGLEAKQDYNKLLELGVKFLSCDKELSDNTEDPDMDYEQDQELIKSSFKYDYGFNPYEKEYMHWWDFFNDLCNLSNSEMGECCALSRVRNLRNYDISKIKDLKERKKVEEAQKRVALKNKKIKRMTKEQEESMQRFLEQINYKERK